MKWIGILIIILLSMNTALAQTECDQETIVQIVESNHKATRTDTHDYMDNKIDQFEDDTETFMTGLLIQFEQTIDGSSKKFMLILMIGIFGITFLVNGFFGLLRLKKEKRILLAMNDTLTKTNASLIAFLHEFKKKVF